MAFDRGSVVLAGRRLNLVREHGGRVGRIVLAAPPDNAFDLEMQEELSRALDTLEAWPQLSALVMEGERDFSVGFLPSYLRPPYVELLLERHGVILRRLAALEAVRIFSLRGRCYGAGFELALLGHVLVADATAKFALPESNVAAFAPAGVALLAGRIGQTRADEWLLSGRVVLGDEAHAAGLVTTFAGGWDTVETAANRYLEQMVLARPVPAIRALAHALSMPQRDRLERLLPGLERLFDERIAGSADHDEGLAAALRGRPPRWPTAG
jgi:enoyl-CoA hydratase/carnithine racemase